MSAADWEAALADVIAAFAARAEHWNDHLGDLDDRGTDERFDEESERTLIRRLVAGLGDAA